MDSVPLGIIIKKGRLIQAKMYYEHCVVVIDYDEKGKPKEPRVYHSQELKKK